MINSQNPRQSHGRIAACITESKSLFTLPSHLANNRAHLRPSATNSNLLYTITQNTNAGELGEAWSHKARIAVAMTNDIHVGCQNPCPSLSL